MENTRPVLFEFYPNLEGKVPCTSILRGLPSNVDRLTELENYLKLKDGAIYIKRDDKDHKIYGGNKLRKFEFIFGEIIKKKKQGVITLGGIGTNHGIACAIIAKELGLKCELFLSLQPLTWHVQRSLLLYDYFGANLHFTKIFELGVLKSLLFRLFHPKYYLMAIGGSPLLGIGTPLGSIGFINAIFELKKQIDEKILPEPDIIFVAAGSTGTAAGLTAGCKLLGMKTKVFFVNVSRDIVVSPKVLMSIANKAIKYLRKRDKSIPYVIVTEEDFTMIKGYLGSEYGIKTVRSQKAVDLIEDLEGKRRDFKLETTYTGKNAAAMLDFFAKEENKSKTVLFWNTYNSNDLDKYLRETKFEYQKLPKKFHKYYTDKIFQCWQITQCPEEIRNKCPAYLNHEYRFWKVLECQLEESKKEKAIKHLDKIIQLEDALNKN
ncbi:MAG: pyridoxal-phosphate dependent enzyme [Candidatus Lokiarchaeota archaeon]|nr:pyridoxal-phosphate dependent enzyme [Candidatus Lokiarchaeota archaeon]